MVQKKLTTQLAGGLHEIDNVLSLGTHRAGDTIHVVRSSTGTSMNASGTDMVMDLAPTGPSAEFPSGRNLRIAFFAGTMRPGHDGVTRVLYRLIDYLREQNIDHSFFSPIVPTDGEYQSIMTRVPSVPFPLYKDYRVALPGQQYFEERLSAGGRRHEVGGALPRCGDRAGGRASR